MKPRRTKTEIAEMRASILSLVMNHDFTVKEICLTHGLSHPYASAILREYGYSSMLVSEGEKAEILARRAGGAWRRSA